MWHKTTFAYASDFFNQLLTWCILNKISASWCKCVCAHVLRSQSLTLISCHVSRTQTASWESNRDTFGRKYIFTQWVCWSDLGRQHSGHFTKSHRSTELIAKTWMLKVWFARWSSQSWLELNPPPCVKHIIKKQTFAQLCCPEWVCDKYGVVFVETPQLNQDWDVCFVP